MAPASDLIVRLFCHAGQDTGYGVAATEIALALRPHCDLQVVPLNPSLSRFDAGRAALLREVVHDGADAAYDVAIVHTMPLDLRTVHDREHAHYGECWGEAGSPRPCFIAYTTWEGVDVPSRVGTAMLGYDEVWLPSHATADAFTQGPRVDIAHAVIPHAYDPSLPRPFKAPGNRFRFYYVGAWTTRKNPHGLLRAFAHAFEPGDDVELVVHSPGVSVEMFAAALVATGLEQKEMPRVRLSNEHLPHEKILELHASMDCFVTATRGEAWNLPAFDAMLAGRMAIAPGGMGHDDFLFEDPDVAPWDQDLTDAIRVSSVHQPAFVDVQSVQSTTGGLAFTTAGAQGLTCKTIWRDPDLVSLATAMRHVYEQRKRDLQVFYKPEEKFGHAAVAKRAIDRIQSLITSRRSS